VLGLLRDSELLLPVATSLSLLGVGLLIALGRRLPPAAMTGLAVALGLFHGYLNGTAMVAAGGGVSALFGIALSAFVLVALVASFVIRLRWAWTRIAVRVAGSWIAAIALLMLGWAVRGA
jgi:hydrogenase/urease accessory protein HupE